MTNMLCLHLLGHPTIKQAGITLSGFTYRKSVALLCYLAVTARPFSRAALAWLLWGDATESNARASLRRTLSDLRQTVALNLVVDRSSVSFDRTAPYWLDVEIFESLLHEALGQEDEQLTMARACALSQAVQLYKGDLLDGFSVHRAPDFEGWLLLQQERLRLGLLEALHALGNYRARTGHRLQAIECFERILALEPAQETAHRQLMYLLALSGQRSQALHQYDLCRRALSEYIDVEPTHATETLHQRILDGRL